MATQTGLAIAEASATAAAAAEAAAVAAGNAAEAAAAAAPANETAAPPVHVVDVSTSEGEHAAGRPEERAPRDKAEKAKPQKKAPRGDKGGKREVHQPQLSCTNIHEH